MKWSLLPALAAVCLVTLGARPSCELRPGQERPDGDDCIVAEVDFMLPHAVADDVYTSVDLTDFGPMSIRSAAETASDYEGGTYRIFVPADTCRDVGTCAERANLVCEAHGWVKAMTAMVSPDDRACGFVCLDGFKATIDCKWGE